MKSKKINLIDYSHDRNDHYKDTANKLYQLINEYSNQQELDKVYEYFEKKYKLPSIKVKQTLKQYIVRSYLLKSAKFNNKLRIKHIPLYILKYGALIYGLFFSKLKKKKKKKFNLIIDYITSSIEMKRWEKLIDLYGKNSVLCITRDTNLIKEFPDYNFHNQKLFRDFLFSDLIKSIFFEFFFGIWVILKASLKTKVNLFPVALNIIHTYLAFKSLFRSYKAPFLIQEKHYNTEPIKNILFKRYGGLASTSIQKNIIATEPIFFYMDLDILFSLGKNSIGQAYNYGGRIDIVYPVGSLFMERGWFDKKIIENKKFDLAILGINTSNAYERLDSFSEFMDDHYSLYRWAAKLSIEKPDIKIVVIHHTSAGEDIIHDNILFGSNVIVLDKMNNSYDIAFSSKCAVTYGSTMGYELNAHNLPTFFVDPGNRCMFLPEKGLNYLDKMRVNSYESFQALVTNHIKKTNREKIFLDEFRNLCIESSHVSNNIFNFLTNFKMKKNFK